MTRRLSVALVHYPVLDRAGDEITTAITNLDLHDIARSCRTYGLGAMYVVHPIEAQRLLVDKVQAHWTTGSGARRIPDRSEPIQLIRCVPSLERAYEHFAGGRDSMELWTTSAKTAGGVLTYQQARTRLEEDGPPVMLLFGTGWGLAARVVINANVGLESIRSKVPSGFNHLSVRAACAISLDRLLG